MPLMSHVALTRQSRNQTGCIFVPKQMRFEHGTQSFIVPKVYLGNACNWKLQLSPISFQHFFTILRSISVVRYYDNQSFCNES